MYTDIPFIVRMNKDGKVTELPFHEESIKHIIKEWENIGNGYNISINENWINNFME